MALQDEFRDAAITMTMTMMVVVVDGSTLHVQKAPVGVLVSSRHGSQEDKTWWGFP